MRRLSLAATVALFVLLEPAGAAPPTQTGNADTFKALNLFAEGFDRVRSDYFEPVKDDELVENALSGLLTALDPHSSYLNAKAYKDMQVDTHGEFGGLGLEVVQDQGLVKVISPIDDTPSAKAGIKAGDYIVALDGDPIVNLSLNEAVEKMRGAPGTTIKITLRREGEPKPIDLTLTRAIIKVASVRGHLERDNIAYLRISSFKEQTSTELEDTFKKLKTQAGKLTGVVLDLRNDPGGLLDQAIAVSDDFLDRGEIVSTRGRRPEDVQRYNAHPGEMTNGLPVVILINGGTASASEIVAGALQDHHRAVVLGTRSFGKGSVQTIIPVLGQGAMRLTTARYFTPSGRSIQAKGIEPDILVEPAKIEKIGGQERLHEADLKGALKNPDDAAKAAATKASATAPATDPSAAKTPDAAPMPGDVIDPTASAKADDYQLSRALDLLKGVSLFNTRAVD